MGRDKTVSDDTLAFRESRLETMRANKEFVKQWNEKHLKAHEQNMETRRKRETHDLRFELTMQEKKQRKLNTNIDNNRNDMTKGISEFESTLQRLGKDSKTQEATTSKSESKKEKSTTSEERKLQTELDAKNFIKRVKSKKEEETIARKDREQRRRRIALEQQRVFEQIEEKRRHEIVLNILIKKSKEEKALAHKLMETAKWKEVMKEDRILREKQHAERRTKDKEEEEALLKEKIIKDREERAARRAILLEKSQKMEQERMERKFQKHLGICEEISTQLVALALKEIEYKEMTEGTAPSAKEVNEWKTLFISGELQLDSTPVEDTNQLQNTPVVQGSSDVLDEKEFHDYLYYDCDWKLEQDNIVMFNPKIADILENIDNMLNPSEPCPSKPVLESKHPYNIVILGKPLSGKSIICDRLAQELGLVQIDPEAILKQRISKDYQQEDISEFDTKLSELIALAKENLVQGQPIDESIIVQIVLNEITRIEQSVFNINGWIIDGFPNTQTSLALLETHISGNDGNPNKRELKSLIIHKEQEQEPEHQEPFLFRAFTSLIFIDVSNDVIFERASSQKIDPETRQLYHMVYEPPPETDIKLLNRLMPMNELRLDKAQLNKNLQVYNKENKIMINYLVQLGTYNTSAHVVPYPDEQEDSLEQLDTLYAQVKQIVNDDKRAIEQIPPPIQITEPSLNVPASSAGRLSPMSPITTRPGTNVSQPEQPVTVPPTPSPDVLVVAPSVPTVPVPLTLEFATLFDSEWYTMENLYITGVKQVFRLLREQRKVLLHQIHQLKTQFVKFLTQKQVSADVQQLVSTFQTDFNQRFQAQDLRTKKQIKQDMHLRVEELREQLWEISDQKKQEAEAELNSIRDGNSFGSLEKMVIRQYMQLVQLECNRFVHETKFIMDYYFQIYQTDHEEPINIEELFIDVVHVPVEVPSTKRAPTKQVPVKSPEKKTKAKVETRSDSQAETPPQLQLDTNIPSVLDRAKGVITQMEVILATLNPAAAVQEEKLKKPKKKTGKKDEVEEDPKSDENAGPSKEQLMYDQLVINFEVEKNCYQTRLLQIQQQCQFHLKELIHSKVLHLYQIMDDWIGKRFRSEMANIQKLTIHIQDSIEREKLLVNELRLQYDGSFIEDETSTVL